MQVSKKKNLIFSSFQYTFWWVPSKGATAEESPSYESVVMSSNIQLLAAVLQVPETIFKLRSISLADSPHMEIGSLNVALVWRSYSIKIGSEVYMHMHAHAHAYTQCYIHIHVCKHTPPRFCKGSEYTRSEFVQDFQSWKRHWCCNQKISLFYMVIVAWGFQVWGDATDTTDYRHGKNLGFPWHQTENISGNAQKGKSTVTEYSVVHSVLI